MNRAMIARWVLTGLSGFFAMSASANDPIQAYPSTLPGLHRHVIQLPATANEQDQQVELIIGKEEQVDCNARSLLGTLTTETVKGWGYDYYQVAIKPGRLSTKMACLPNSTKKRFITLPLNTAQRFIRYNSKLPIVVYAPQDIAINYRVWQAKSAVMTAEQK
ncbi:serine protease inhibitor ecotin [Rosenbergiella metrosideri]|uniref:serine protease inhibitor ecotin n=1 Tax=Rosenbergiella metrosideri TaxID=2921185 RepID=UPI001F4FED2F|nr:serine protease inhibitor ecotin [Rosenbergiella metrosideri]